MKPEYRRMVVALLAQFSGQDNTLTIPRPFITMCGGDVTAALLLNQILYWSDRATLPDGWFYKSYREWEEELGLSAYQVKRAINGDPRSKKGFVGLHTLGVETALKPVEALKGAPTLHYRINRDMFGGHLLRFIGSDYANVLNNVENTVLNIVKGSVFNNVDRAVFDNVNDLTTETTTENTKEQNTANAVHEPVEVVETAANEVLSDSQNPAEPDRAPAKPKRKPTDWQLMIGFCAETWECATGKATKLAQLLLGRVQGDGLYAASNLNPPADLREARGWRHWINQSHRKKPTTPDWIQESFYEFRGNMAYADAIRDANDPKPDPTQPPEIEPTDEQRAQRDAVKARIAALSEAKSLTPERMYHDRLPA